MGLQLIIRVREKGARGDKCYNFKREVNLHDPNMIALVLSDLISEFNLPLEKTLTKMGYRIQKKDDFFPFLTK